MIIERDGEGEGAHLEALLTDYLVVGEAHDVHGVQSLLEVILVLLAGDGDVTVGEETVVVKVLEQQVRWGRKERI